MGFREFMALAAEARRDPAAWDARYEQREFAIEAAEERTRLHREADMVATIPEKLGKMGVPDDVCLGLQRQLHLDPEQRYATVSSRAAVRFLSRLSDRERVGMVLSGPSGCGKTYAAAWLLYRCCTWRRALAFDVYLNEHAGKCISAVRLSELGRFGEDAALWEDCKRAKCLVIDDLGLENCGDEWKSRFADLMSWRLGSRNVTVITSMASRDQIVARYGAAVRSRMLARCEWSRAEEPDMRLMDRSEVKGGA